MFFKKDEFMKENKEFVTGVELIGNYADYEEKLKDLFYRNLMRPSLLPIRADWCDYENDKNGDLSETICVKNGLVIPCKHNQDESGLHTFEFNVISTSGTPFSYYLSNYTDIVPGMMCLSSDESYSYITFSLDSGVYYDGIKVAKELGLWCRVVERARFNKNGGFEITHSEIRPDLVKGRDC